MVGRIKFIRILTMVPFFQRLGIPFVGQVFLDPYPNKTTKWVSLRPVRSDFVPPNSHSVIAFDLVDGRGITGKLRLFAVNIREAVIAPSIKKGKVISRAWHDTKSPEGQKLVTFAKQNPQHRRLIHQA